MDACEIASFLERELFMNQFASIDGIHSGVPTKTTPTVTPTTLRTIEQMFGIEQTTDTSSNIPCQAGFVPPPFQFEDHSQDRENSRESMSSEVSDNSWQVTPPPIISEDLDSKSSSTSYEREVLVSQPRLMVAGVHGGITSHLATLNPAITVQQIASGAKGNRKQAGQNGDSTTPATPRRNMGGRRPAKASNLSPEEEQKRSVRRERNKQAAARCRRRREDHTNELVDETDQLEKKKQALQEEINQLLHEKEDLQFLLDSHKERCRLIGRHSPLERKPMELIPHAAHLATMDLKVNLPIKIKAEPEELPEEPPKKKLIMSNAFSDSLDTPTPMSLAPVLTSVNLPRLMIPTAAGFNGRPQRPGTLDVKATATLPLRNITADAGIGISTPSNGFFNFESLMDGGTGLTPVAAPISIHSNRGPLELNTPTSSEPSKLCSL